MLVAAIGDIHGNLPALEAVLLEIDEEGIHTILNTGDCVVGFPWPDEVIELLRDRQIPTVQGEMDRFAVRFLRKQQSFKDKWSQAEYDALQWTHENMRSENLEFLRSLPKQVRITLEEIEIMLCHGTPTGQADELHPDDPKERFERQREAANAHLIVLGKTHTPLDYPLADTLFVNPGSVGMPDDAGAFACYSIIDTDRSPWRVSHRRVAYDMAEVEKRLAECGLERP